MPAALPAPPPAARALADVLQLALDEPAADYPDARNRSPREFYDEGFVREPEQSGFIASLYR